MTAAQSMVQMTSWSATAWRPRLRIDGLETSLRRAIAGYIAHRATCVAQDPGRHPDRGRVGRDIGDDQRVCRDPSAITDFHGTQDFCSRADEDIVADRRSPAVVWGRAQRHIMHDADPITDHGSRVDLGVPRVDQMEILAHLRLTRKDNSARGFDEQ